MTLMDLAQRQSLPTGPELRSYPAEFEVRSVAGSPSKVELRGYASVFNAPYPMNDSQGQYTEQVRPGAFSDTLASQPDVAYLANHEGLTMARTSSGSLQLSQDSRGLHTVAQVNTTRTDVKDLVTAIEDGDVDQMSFAFRVTGQEWSPDWLQRSLVAVDINHGDVSAVNFGASGATNVALQRDLRANSCRVPAGPSLELLRRRLRLT
jgi:HK97 family phage prohead protease